MDQPVTTTRNSYLSYRQPPAISRSILPLRALFEVVCGPITAIGGDLLRCSRKFGHTSPSRWRGLRPGGRGLRSSGYSFVNLAQLAQDSGYLPITTPRPKAPGSDFTAITRCVNTTPWWHIPSPNKATNGIAYCIPGSV